MEFSLIGMWQSMSPLAKGVSIILITMSIVSVLPSQVIRDVSAPTAAPELEMRAPQAQAAAGRGTSTRADASRSEHAAIRTSLMHGTVRRWEG